jgi:hypothetical protein
VTSIKEKSIDPTVLAGDRNSSLAVFQVHCIDAEGKVLIRRKLKRAMAQVEDKVTVKARELGWIA